jgi:hypothetical protein
MRLNRNRSRAPESDRAAAPKKRREGRGWGPFTGTQLTLIIGMLAAVVAFPMIASAVIPNGNTFNACAKKTGGALRLIDPSKHQKCKTTENTESWSKTGPKGAPGTPGTPGTPGSARAYGYVQSDGTLVAARSKNITLTLEFNPFSQAGEYCVQLNSNIDPASIAPVVTATGVPGGTNSTAALDFSASDLVGVGCGGYDFLVFTSRNGSLFPTGFAISVP